MKYGEDLSSLSFDNLLKTKFTQNNKRTNNSNIIDYINSIKKHYSKESGSLFFKGGWYVNQSVISSLCLCTNDQQLENFDFSKSPYKINEYKFGFNFQIRDKNELDYLKFICKLNQHVYYKSKSNRFNLTDFYRLFYIVFDSGGKTFFDTDTIFSVSTHEPILAYSIVRKSSSLLSFFLNYITSQPIKFQTTYREITVDYSISHLLHFRESLDFLISKPLFPSLIRFDLNYLNLINNL